jgi:hypothetical protein
MAWASIKLSPGLNTELTPSLNTAGYTSTNLGRFKAGLFQKLGGWTKYYVNLLSGSPKRTMAWQDLSGADRLAIGTSSKLYDLTSGVLSNITPQKVQTSVAVNFATTLGSPIVTIVDTDITSVTAYDSVNFETPVSVGGIILAGLYPITAYVSSGCYTITAATPATSTVTSPGGAVPTFATTSGQSTITVAFNNHGLSAGDDIIFPLPTTAGGVVIQGRYVVQSVVTGNSFTILAGTAAASTTGSPVPMNSGEAGFTYHLAIGPLAVGAAYGSSSYSDGAYGLGVPVSGQTGADITATDWDLANWGEILIGCPRGDAIYYWGPASGFQNAGVISSGPAYNTGAFVSIAQQMIIAYGSTATASIGCYWDPMLVRWCDVENFFEWTQTSTTQAGEYRIPTGSRVVGGAATPHRNLIWTDQDLWSMDYIGATLVFGFNKIGSNCGLISQHAHTQLADAVYWMSASSFFVLTGSSVAPIPCSVWDAVFQDLDTANADKCFAGSNTAFGEVWFFYPSKSGGLGYCDKYAKLNTQESTWDIGDMQRNTWMDQSVVGAPIAMTNGGVVYQHETGPDADNAPLTPAFETGWFFIDEGRELVFVDRIIPDARWGEFGGSQDAELKVTIKAVKYPGDTPRSYGPFSITQTKQFISQRLRARQVMLRIESDDMGSFWRIGLFRFRYAPDGRM